MSKFLYFAYGSNMLTKRLRARTPSAKPICQAVLKGHSLTFHKVSKDGSGKCHIQNTGNSVDSVIGVLFQIRSEEKNSLDKAEGLGFGYEEALKQVVDPDGGVFEAVCYVGTALEEGRKPYRWYKGLVLAGANEHGLDRDYIRQIETVDSLEDPNLDRRLRNEKILTS